MDSASLRRHKLNNLLHSALLLGGMSGLLALLGWLMAGAEHNLHVDICGAVDRKIDALLAHRSQNDDRADFIPEMIREWSKVQAEAAGLEGRLVESFRVVVTE